MAPNRQKVVAPKQPDRKPGRKPGRQKQKQPATPVPGTTTTGIKLKLKFKRDAQGDARSPLPASQVPLTALLSDVRPEEEEEHPSTTWNGHEQGTRRGARARTKTHMPDMVFGSEMDTLMSSATLTKIDNADDVHMISSPSKYTSLAKAVSMFSLLIHIATIVSTHASKGYEFSHRFSPPLDQDLYDILNTLHSSSCIQVDLPNMWASGDNGAVKRYTASFLTHLYIKCYESHLWHFCDLVADTWIRALQKANRRSHRSSDKRDHMWRANIALERIFSEKKKGFKADVHEFNLDVQDPDLDDDVTDFDTKLLQLLYEHTDPGCGARLLWADAMALCGRKMEGNICRRPGAWPQELFYDVMCTGLRMVGRKLTLKIEEKYEGAWCRYHEHVKHGQPCYRELAWQQKVVQEEDEREAGLGEEQGEAKRLRFDAEDLASGGEQIDIGDLDAEGESEEE